MTMSHVQTTPLNNNVSWSNSPFKSQCFMVTNPLDFMVKNHSNHRQITMFHGKILYITMFHCEKSLKTPPLSLKSPGILLKGLLLKVAILAIKKNWKLLKNSQESEKISKNNWKNNNPRFPKRIPKNKKKRETKQEKTEQNPQKKTQTKISKKQTNWTNKFKKQKKQKQNTIKTIEKCNNQSK